jgi:hypothetical protein
MKPMAHNFFKIDSTFILLENKRKTFVNIVEFVQRN